MQRIGQIMRQQRRERGWTLQQLADAAGCSKAYLSGVENDRVANPPRPGILRRIERALDLDPGTLIRLREWRTTPEAVRRDYQWMARQLQQLGAPRLELGTRNAERSEPQPERPAPAGPVPRSEFRVPTSNDLDAMYRSGALQRCADGASGNIDRVETGREGAHGGPPAPTPLINRVAAGYPRQFTDLDYPARVADEYLVVPGVSDPDAFAARVVGDSMSPDYHAGDIVIFSPSRDAADGDDCFVRLEPDHDTTFKRVYFDDDTSRVRLVPLNDTYPTRTVARDQIAGLYPAVYRMAPIVR
ncbi:MAG: helix-turn-helix domain-containing protein [Phycisphaera sp.]|nr:helix-turn-helix domain-containing protein [Phycisphaera sp.]